MIDVAVAIILKNGSSRALISPDTLVLLCQRKRTARYGLKWEFPGGKVEQGESIEQCLHRELLEELNLEADVGPLFHKQRSVYPDGGAFNVWYHLVAAYKGQIENRAFESYQWVTIQHLHHYDILEGNHDVLKRLLDSEIATKK